MPRSGKKVSTGRRARVSAPVAPCFGTIDGAACSPGARHQPEQLRHADREGRKLKLLPARLKALRLHGRYLGYMRQLKAKAEVRALRAKKGVRAAIARARRLAGR